MPATVLGREVRERGRVAMAALALLAACARERPPGVVRVTYDCDEGNSFAARYERDGQVILELGDGEWVLPEVSALAGTRYDDGTHELQLHGRHAILRGTAATYSNCVVRDWQKSEPRQSPSTWSTSWIAASALGRRRTKCVCVAPIW